MSISISSWQRTISTSCLSFWLLACSPEKVPAGLVYCSEGNPESFNPQLVTSGTTIDATSKQLYDRLVDYDVNSGEIIPKLATSWQTSDDGLSYTFSLRQGVAFHTNDIFTPKRNMNADDVVFSFQRIIDAKHPYHEISRTGYPYFESIDFASQIESVKKLNDNQVVFKLTHKNATFLPNLASSFAVILSAEYGNYLQTINQQASLDQHPIGTGPFLLKDYVKNEYIRFQHNPNYWSKQPDIDLLVFDITPKSGARLLKLITGDCDISAHPKAGERDAVSVHPEIKQLAAPEMNLAFWGFNTQKYPFNKVQVRQALNLAVNKNKILHLVYQDTATVAQGILPPASWAYAVTDQQIKANRNTAKTLLKEAGINNLSMDIWAIPVERSYNPNTLKTATLIQADLAKIGVKANIVSYGWRIFAKQLQKSDFDSVLMGWSADNNDPDNFFTPLLSCQSIKSGTNLVRWCNEKFDSIINQAKRTSELIERKQLYQQAESLLAKELPLIPLAHGQRQFLVNDKVDNLIVSPYGGITFADASLSHRSSNL